MWTLLAVTGRELSAWDAGVFLAFICVLLWWHGRGCECERDRGTFLKPKWKRHDRK